MSYTPTNWQTGDIVSSEKLNKMEEGIANAHSEEYIVAETDEWLEENITQETGYVLDRSLQSANAAAPADIVGDIQEDVSDAKNALSACEDGTGILVETGYLTNAQKALNNSVGFSTVSYDPSKKILNVVHDRETSGTGTATINFGDYGLTKDNSGVSITDYPYLIYSFNTAIDTSVAIKLRIWAYSGNANSTIEIPITKRDGSRQTVDLKKLFSDAGLSASYNVAYIRAIVTDSFTYTTAIYNAELYGFFTAEQVTGLNLKEKVENLSEDVIDLKGETSALNGLANALFESAASDAPVTMSVVDGILGTDGKFASTSSFVSTVTDKIKCKQGDVFYYFGQCSDSVVACMWFDDDGDILGYDRPSDSGYFKHITYTAPANADAVIFTSYIGKASGYNPGLVVTRGETYVSPLSRKVWYACGDSFTAGEFTGISNSMFTSGKYTGKLKTYPYHIGNRTNVDVRRGSTSGETIATYTDGSVVFSDAEYTYGYKSVGIDADYITLWFGINDSGRNIPIGTIDDDDNTTFYGAWNVVLDDLTTRCTKAHIGIIVSNNLSSSYVDAVIAVAKKWGVPYLDLNYDNSVPLMHYSLRPDASAEIKAKRNAQFAISSENHHPNLLAHEYESYFIEKWLLSL